MKILKKLQIIFLALAIFFIFRLLKNNLKLIDFGNLEFQLIPLLFAVFFSVVSFFFLVTKLSVLYEIELPKISFWQLFKTVAKTNLYRYIPGGVWNHAGLAVETSLKSGKSLKTTGKLQFLNVAFMVYTGGWFLFFVLPSPFNWILLAVFAAGLFLPNLGFSIINRKKIDPKTLRLILLNNFLFWLFIGLAFVYFLQGLGIVGELEIKETIYLASSYILAWLAGFLFLPAPAGVGIREAVLGYFFASGGYSLALGVSVSLLYRLFILGRDLLVYLSSLFVRNSG